MELAAVDLDQPQPVGANRSELLAAVDADDILAGAREARAEVAADGTGTDDGNLHRRPSIRPVRHRAARSASRAASCRQQREEAAEGALQLFHRQLVRQFLAPTGAIRKLMVTTPIKAGR
jgi:hypothetical protein